MRRMSYLLAPVCVLALVLVFSLSAFAATTAKFTAVHSSVDTSGKLVVSFTETGVSSQSINYSGSWTETEVFKCSNGPDQRLVKPMSETLQGTIEGFTGNSITIAVSIAPEPAPSSCKNAKLSFVSYTGITLTDTTNNISTSVPDASRLLK